MADIDLRIGVRTARRIRLRYAAFGERHLGNAAKGRCKARRAA